MINKTALGQVFSEYFGTPVNYSTNFSIIIIIQGWHNRPISGDSAKWTLLDTTPHYINLKKKLLQENVEMLSFVAVLRRKH
jgi:hypothetical protein